MSKKTTVKSKYLRISPKKVIPHLKKFKGLSVEEAKNRCFRLDNKTAQLIDKLIDSGVAAAKEQDLEEDKLIVKSLVCQTGPTMKRQLIRSRGRADVIKKRSSHLKLSLSEKSEKNKKKKEDNNK